MTAANSVSAGGIDMSAHKKFMVGTSTFRRFETGRAKFSKWSKYLDLTKDTERQVYEYAKKNPKSSVILQDEETGALRAIRRTCKDGS